MGNYFETFGKNLKKPSGFQFQKRVIRYHGENSIEYSPFPSILRTVNGEGKLDFAWLKNQYSKQTIEAYKELFGENRSKDIFEDIEFYEMTQHALGMSPFLDFTKDANVAYSMTLHSDENCLCRVLRAKRSQAYSCKGNKFSDVIKAARNGPSSLAKTSDGRQAVVSYLTTTKLMTMDSTYIAPPEGFSIEGKHRNGSAKGKEPQGRALASWSFFQSQRSTTTRLSEMEPLLSIKNFVF